jgi:hypothetical protein
LSYEPLEIQTNKNALRLVLEQGPAGALCESDVGGLL